MNGAKISRMLCNLERLGYSHAKNIGYVTRFSRCSTGANHLFTRANHSSTSANYQRGRREEFGASDYSEAEYKHDRKKTKHRFERLHSWKGPEGLAQYLLENIIYQNKNMLVFAKPSGIPMFEMKYEDMEAAHPEHLVSMDLAMNFIKRWLNTDFLKPVYSQPRLYSGLVIYSRSPEADTDFRNYFVYTKTQKVKFQKYRVICCGVPLHVDEDVFFPIWREQTEQGNVFFESPKVVKRDFEKRLASRFHMDFHILRQTRIGQSQVSYVEAKSYISKWDALELCLAQHQLCPALGDDLYSHRVQKLQGRKILVSAENAPIERTPQKLDPDIAKALDLRSETDTDHLPLHIHCSEIQIPSKLHGGKRQDEELVTFKAPLPDFFTQSLQDLDLIVK